MYSIFIKNGLIVDGTGAAAYPANLGITGDKITYIGNEVFEAEQTIDATGKMVTPGFIDVHSHGDLARGEEFTGLAKRSVRLVRHSFVRPPQGCRCQLL